MPVLPYRGTPRGKRYATAVLADNPLLYWPLDETGTLLAFDGTTNNRHGTYSGATLGVRSPLVTTTRRNAPDFDGINDLVEMPAIVTSATVNWSMELWYRADTTIQYAVLMSNGSDGGGYCLAHAASGGGSGSVLSIIRNNLGWLGSSYTFTETVLSHHIVAACNGSGNVYLWVDGVNCLTTTSTFNSPADSKFTAGAQYNSGASATQRFTDGALSHVAVYNYALTPGQVLHHYQVGAGLI